MIKQRRFLDSVKPNNSTGFVFQFFPHFRFLFLLFPRVEFGNVVADMISYTICNGVSISIEICRLFFSQSKAKRTLTIKANT
jgi:hypothetical protein